MLRQLGFGPRFFLCLFSGLLFLFQSDPVAAHGVAPLGGAPAGAEKPVPNFFERWLKSFEAEAAARIRVDAADGYRYITSDGLPDHPTGTFPNHRNPHTISEQSYSFRMPIDPQKTRSVRTLGHHPFGVALNGVIFDPLTAEYWNRDRSSGWNIEALSGMVNLGLDDSNAHVQPDGAYHYHGIPTGLLNRLAAGDKPVLLGYAADGFPIFGPYDGATSSHRVKSGTRPSGPGGRYDGYYVQDYEYSAGAGTLDQCNGRTAVMPGYPNGTYHYVLTQSYPFIPRCFFGEIDSSFIRVTPDGGNMGAGRKGNTDGPMGPGMNQGPGPSGPPGAPPGGGRPGGPPDLNAAAAKLGVDVQTLRRALGPPPPNFNRAAKQLGISEEVLRRALGH